MKEPEPLRFGLLFFLEMRTFLIASEMAQNPPHNYEIQEEALSPEQALEAYLFHLRHERGLSASTQIAAAQVQRTWESWLLKNGHRRNWMQATR